MMVSKSDWLRSKNNRFLLLLLAADALFILLGALHAYTPYFADDGYSLSQDRGFAETYQYVQEYWVALLFVLISFRKSAWSYLVWSALFVYLLLDDSFLIHERLGLAVSNALAFTAFADLRARDYGELIVAAGIGVIFLALIALVYWRGSVEDRGIARRMVLYLIVLALVGVLLDMVDILVGKMLGVTSPLFDLTSILEDGGEMVVMSVICAYVFALLDREHDTLQPVDDA